MYLKQVHSLLDRGLRKRSLFTEQSPHHETTPVRWHQSETKTRWACFRKRYPLHTNNLDRWVSSIACRFNQIPAYTFDLSLTRLTSVEAINWWWEVDMYPCRYQHQHRWRLFLPVPVVVRYYCAGARFGPARTVHSPKQISQGTNHYMYESVHNKELLITIHIPSDRSTYCYYGIVMNKLHTKHVQHSFWWIQKYFITTRCSFNLGPGWWIIEGKKLASFQSIQTIPGKQPFVPSPNPPLVPGEQPVLSLRH